MDIRRAITTHGRRLHRTEITDQAGRGDTSGYARRFNGDFEAQWIRSEAHYTETLITFCNFSVYSYEPEEAGHRDQWNDREREMGSCVRCDKAIQKLAEA